LTDLESDISDYEVAPPWTMYNNAPLQSLQTIFPPLNKTKFPGI